ncbi:MAG: SGNH/GDSL hydrolase family protein [Candidatus Omnitrophica bacterium]|nr:SGNH/GDSL hydrolase family protein [Candidatus Omnitrophota bacterium]
MSVIKRWIKIFITAIFIFILTLCLLEVLIRVFRFPHLDVEPRYFYIHDDLLGWKLAENNHVVLHTSEYHTDVQTNSQGFRDREHSQIKPEGTYRILGLGDSFTFGFGVEGEETYLVQMEKKLNDMTDRKITYEIINMGIPGYSFLQESLLFKEKAIQYQPDMVMIGFDVNDHVDSLEPFHVPYDGFLLRAESVQQPFIKERLFLSRHFKSVHLILRGVELLYEYLHSGDETSASKRSQEALNFVEKRLQIMSQISHEKGIRLVLFFIPHRGQVHPGWFKEPSFYRYFDDLEKRLSEICAQHGVLYIDLLPELLRVAQKGERLYFKADGHWNSRGHQVAADYLLGELKKRGIL